MFRTGQFTGKFYQTYKEEIIPIVFPKIEEDRTLPNSFYEATIHYSICIQYRCKNPQQNISKPNATLYKKDCAS